MQNSNRRHRLEQTLVRTSNFESSYQQLGERITQRLKEINKRRALRGKQTVELLTNSAGKRTVVLLNPSFFYFAPHKPAHQATGLLPSLLRYQQPMETVRTLKTLLLLSLYSFIAFGQDNLEAVGKRIASNGNFLYQNIRKSDLLLTTFRKSNNPNYKIGSLAYLENGKEIGIVFQLHSDSSSVLMTTEFQHDSVFNVDTVWRNQTVNEFILADIYKNSYASGGLWSQWSKLSGVDFWIVIKKTENGFTSYILTKSLNENILPIGNDFTITYNAKGKYKDFSSLHNNYIRIPLNPTTNLDNLKESFHTHANRNSAYITATDICILKLYADKLKYKKHFVGSKKYISEYNVETNELIILTREEFQRKEGISKLNF